MTGRVLTLLDQPAAGQTVPGDDGTLAPPAGWPAPPDRAVYHELLGEIVNTIAPHTEADPIAILSQLLVAFGAAAGRGAYFTVEATRHAPNEFMLLVGDSSPKFPRVTQQNLACFLGLRVFSGVGVVST